jgi:hypothetical protein
MNPFELLLLAGAIGLPFHLLVVREFEKLTDPRYLREHGVVILSSRALEDHALPIGTYMGQSIWESVTFKGMQYRFDRVAPPSYRNRVGPGELFLAPGLVYVTR